MPKVEKKILSQYFRTQCDKHLFLMLHEDRRDRAFREASGMPEPLRIRPLSPSLAAAGQALEEARYALLERLFPGRVTLFDRGGKSPGGVESLERLEAGPHSFLLEATFDTGALKDDFFRALGIADHLLPRLPDLSDIRPDILCALGPDTSFGPRDELVPVAQREVLPDGRTRALARDDPRTRIGVIDIKHAEHANPGYAAEVTFYTMLLSLWIVRRGLAGRYAVTDQAALWTGGRGERCEEGIPASERWAFVNAGLEPVPFEQYAVTVRKFFTEDIPRVLDAPDWRRLDWHVNARCSLCDYLAFDEWIRESDRARVTEHHCHRRARECDHLSLVPFLTRGMRRTLDDGAVRTRACLAALAPDAAPLQSHNALKRDAAVLAARARALTEGTILEPTRTWGGMPRWADCQIYPIVNFDAGTGAASCFGLTARWVGSVPEGGEKRPSRRWPATAFLVREQSDAAEYEALLGFLRMIAGVVATVYDAANNPGIPLEKVKGATVHFFFWDASQFEFLKKAIGRHLHRLIEEGDRALKGLAWLFPPREVVEHYGNVDAPVVSFVKDLLRVMVALPVAHAYGIIPVANAYVAAGDPARRFTVPKRFSDPFHDQVPRERIYEIWYRSAAPPWEGVIASYERAVRTMAIALRSITEKLQREFGKRLAGRTRPVGLAGPYLPRQMAFDAKLWLAFSRVDEKYGVLEEGLRSNAPEDELESRYVSIRCVAEVTASATGQEYLASYGGPRRRVYRVSEEARNSKIKDEARHLTIVSDAVPGLPNRRLVDLLDPAIAGLGPAINPYLPLRALLSFDIVHFDRIDGYVVLALRGDSQEVLHALRRDAGIGFEAGFSLVEKSSEWFADRLRECLVAIGNPPVALPDPATLAALGVASSVREGSDAMTPAAEVLWDAGRLARAASWGDRHRAERILDWIERDAGCRKLDRSQRSAAMHALFNRLTIVWGPPGTGKTDVGAAIVLGRVCRAIRERRGVRLFITGPTYRAVEELVTRTLAGFASLGAFRRVRLVLLTNEPDGSPWRALRERGSGGFSVEIAGKKGEIGGAWSLDRFAAQLLDGRDEIVVVAGTVYGAHSIAKACPGCMPVRPLFDFMVMDESSQVDVPRAVLPLSALAEGFQLVLLGDHLQMPPIHHGTPPRGAEHLVGSVQAYLMRRFGVPTRDLLVNYRSNESIVSFGHLIGYREDLVAAHRDIDVVLSNEPPPGAADDPGSPLYEASLLPGRRAVALTYQDGRSGQANDFEAALTAGIVRHAYARVGRELCRGGDCRYVPNDPEHFWRYTIGVVTPHKAQRAVVLRSLHAAFPDHDFSLIERAVDTVERFQGGERDIVIISFGVGDPDLILQEEEFLLQLNRTNVAISRARAKCVMLISDELIHHLPDDPEVVRTARAVKNYVHQYCGEREEICVAWKGELRKITVRYRKEVEYLP